MGKGKWMKKLLFLTVLLWLLPGFRLCQAKADCDIEQISMYMPDIRIYYRAQEPETEYEAYLGGEALTYDSTELFKDTGMGTDYYILLDISASIPDEKFRNLKNGISSFISSKGEDDRCILLTLGDAWAVALHGDETSEEAADVIGGLTNDNMETVLFQTIIQAAKMIDQAAQTEEKRRVIIAVTDGEDCVTGQATSAEALNTLKEKGIPLYAVAVDVGKEAYINSFGEFARNTGGTLSIYSQGESLDTFREIRSVVQNSYVAAFHSRTNEAGNKREDLTVKFLKHQTTVTREVIPTRWKEDTSVPEVLSAEVLGDNEIRIRFSEPVLGADNQGNYKIKRDGEAISIGSVFYSEETEPEAVLTFSEPLYTGDYEIVFSDITDHSMEKNALSKSYKTELQGEDPKDTRMSELLQRFGWLAAAAALAAVVIFLAAAVFLYKKIKKNKGVIYVEGKATLAANVDVKQHVSTKNLPRKAILMVVRDRGNGKCKLDVTINGSTMVGRSSDCEVYFDDPKMSRQHFVLETDGEHVYVMDLETKNGTFVNGIRLNQKRKLSPDDEIEAGDVRLKVLW